jgi:hypothetical protein
MDRIRRQPVDDKIFRRAAIFESFSKVDFNATDAGDALDARKLGLAFLQGAVSPVALPSDLIEVLSQPLCGGRFGKGLVLGDRRHSRN